MAASEPRRFRLFVYGTLLEGEPDHAILQDAELLGPVSTAEGYTLVERGAFGGMFEGGDGQVVGELYEVVYETLAACDKKRDHPRLYHRKEIVLADGSRAFTYLWHRRQARGLRRVKDGDWRERFSPRKPGELREAGPFVRWSRERYRGKPSE